MKSWNERNPARQLEHTVRVQDAGSSRRGSGAASKLLARLLFLSLILLLAACGDPRGAEKAPSEEVTTGELRLTVIGLPEDVDANIRVSGPTGAPLAPTGDVVLKDLPPGDYTVLAQAVAAGSVTYNPVAGTAYVQIEAGKTTEVEVRYEMPGITLETPAALDVPFHAAADLSVSVTRTGGFTGPVSISVAGLPEGISASLPFVIAEGETNGTMRFTNETHINLEVDEATAVTLTATAGTLQAEADVSVSVIAVVTSATDTTDSLVAGYFGSLRDLIRNAESASGEPVVITFDPELFAEPVTIKLEEAISIKRSPVRVEGPVAADGLPRVTLDADGDANVMVIGDVPGIGLSNLILTGAVGGPGVRNLGGGLLIHNSIIEKNVRGGNGGGLFNIGEVTITDSEIRDNSARNGGGIYNGVQGGFTGKLTVHNSTLSNNKAVPDGPGSFGEGGALYNEGNAVTLNSTIAGNHADINGGGIWSDGAANTDVLFSTITYNEAGNRGGGIEAEGPVSLRGTIVALNAAGFAGNDIFAFEPVSSRGYNLVGTGVAFGDFISEPLSDKVGVPEPRLGLLSDNGGPTRTVALREDSPALRGVKGSACQDLESSFVRTDQRGLPRTGAGSETGTCDIGAFEAP